MLYQGEGSGNLSIQWTWNIFALPRYAFPTPMNQVWHYSAKSSLDYISTDDTSLFSEYLFTGTAIGLDFACDYNLSLTPQMSGRSSVRREQETGR